MTFKTNYTPLEDIASFLSDEKEQAFLSELGTYIKKIEGEFDRVRSIFPFTLTEESKQKFIDLEEIKTPLKKEILASGLLVAFESEEWLEGKEMLEGLRPIESINEVKACKLLTMIMKRDVSDFGYYEQHLKRGTILQLLKIITAIDNEGLSKMG
jgi:hypothetical protein